MDPCANFAPQYWLTVEIVPIQLLVWNVWMKHSIFQPENAFHARVDVRIVIIL